MGHAFEPVVERLVIASCFPPYSTSETAKFGLVLSSKMQSTPEPALILMHIIGKEALAPEVAESYRRLMERDNVWVTRVALWVSSGGPLAQQLGDVARNASNPKRKVSADAKEIQDWLSELASPGEKDAMRAYVRAKIMAS